MVGTYGGCTREQCRGVVPHSPIMHAIPLGVHNIVATPHYHAQVCTHGTATHSLALCMTYAVADEVMHVLMMPVRVCVRCLAWVGRHR
jgi:hypothetical protein